jgi:hypothetical protein
VSTQYHPGIELLDQYWLITTPGSKYQLDPWWGSIAPLFNAFWHKYHEKWPVNWVFLTDFPRIMSSFWHFDTSILNKSIEVSKKYKLNTTWDRVIKKVLTHYHSGIEVEKKYQLYTTQESKYQKSIALIPPRDRRIKKILIYTSIHAKSMDWCFDTLIV